MSFRFTLRDKSNIQVDTLQIDKKSESNTCFSTESV